MNEMEANALLRHALQNILILVEDQPPDWQSRCLTLGKSALSQTHKPVSRERTLIPGINEKDLMQIVKS